MHVDDDVMTPHVELHTRSRVDTGASDTGGRVLHRDGHRSEHIGHSLSRCDALAGTQGRPRPRRPARHRMSAFDRADTHSVHCEAASADCGHGLRTNQGACGAQSTREHEFLLLVAG